MCGIVGLLIKNPAMRTSLGQLLVPMLEGMGERGPDSAGLAVFSENGQADMHRFSLYAPTVDYDWAGLCTALQSHFEMPAALETKGKHAVLCTGLKPALFKPWLVNMHPALHLLGVGLAMDIYKDIGHPREVAARYEFTGLRGSHGIGHTRMATESAVSPAHAHPFTAGEDFCLVHNGSLSNPYSLRRQLEAKGIRFETDNDTEAACRFLEWRMRDGDDLETALHKAFRELDGFYTLLMGTRNRMALVRDAFACKPAVVAETNDYVAVASEFRSLSHLPGIQHARLFEPQPEEIHVWTI